MKMSVIRWKLPTTSAGVDRGFGDDFIHKHVVRADDEVIEQLRFVAKAHQLAVGTHAFEQPVVVTLTIAHPATASG